jgi:hypothetical protein
MCLERRRSAGGPSLWDSRGEKGCPVDVADWQLTAVAREWLSSRCPHLTSPHLTSSFAISRQLYWENVGPTPGRVAIFQNSCAVRRVCSCGLAQPAQVVDWPGPGRDQTDVAPCSRRRGEKESVGRISFWIAGAKPLPSREIAKLRAP